jgi:hypothetical protein
MTKARLALSAGLGSGFSLLFLLAISQEARKSSGQWVRDASVIVIVASGIGFYFEPLFERMKFRIRLSAPEDDQGSVKGRTRLLQAGAFILVGLIGITHAMLHTVVEDNGPEYAVALLVPAIVLPGAITYVWLRQVQLGRRAALPGAGVGAIAGGGVVLLLFAMFGARLGDGELARLDATQIETFTLLNAFSFAVSGFFGGLALDRRWAGGGLRGVAIVLLLALPCLWAIEMPFNPLRDHRSSADIAFRALHDSVRILGWIGGLLCLGGAFDAALKPRLDSGINGPNTPRPPV